MIHNDALIVDYGPNFYGHVSKVDKGIVCVVPRHLGAGSPAALAMQEMVRDQGGSCGGCLNCPLGRGN